MEITRHELFVAWKKIRETHQDQRQIIVSDFKKGVLDSDTARLDLDAVTQQAYLISNAASIIRHRS